MVRRDKNDAIAECAAPPPLSDDDLLAALDGDVHAPVRAHLDRCASCSSRLESMRMFEQSLQSLMHRAGCPPADRLADYVMGSLIASDRAKIDQHLQGCVLCQREVEHLRAVFNLADIEESESAAPEPVWQQVRGMFQSLEEQLVRILLPQPAPAYGQLKGSSGPRNRLLTYASEPVSVMLALEKGVDGLKINGSIIDTKEQDRWRDSQVELVSLAEGQRRYVALVDDDEMFTLSAVAPGRFNLNVYALTGQILRLQDIELTL